MSRRDAQAAEQHGAGELVSHPMQHLPIQHTPARVRSLRLCAARLLRLALCLLALAAAPLRADDAPPSFQDVEESLTCQCGCGLTVHSCNHLQCGSALPLRAEIREQMDQGKSKDDILAHFADKYGEKILSSPTTTGINIAAWATPFILLAIGGIGVGIAVSRWGRRGGRPPASPQAPASPSEHQRILDRELQHFDG